MVKSLPANSGNLGASLIPELGKDLLEKGMVTRFGILAWENPLDRGAWRATAHEGCKESRTAEHTCMHVVRSPHWTFLVVIFS